MSLFLNGNKFREIYCYITCSPMDPLHWTEDKHFFLVQWKAMVMSYIFGVNDDFRVNYTFELGWKAIKQKY